MVRAKSTSYTLSNHPQRPNLGIFYCTTSRFRDTRLSKIGKIRNAPNDLKMILNTNQSKVSCIHQVLNTKNAHLLVRFSLRSAAFKIQGLWKSEMHRMTPNWTCTLNSQKNTICTKYYTRDVSLYDQRFRRYRTFYNSPLTTMLKTKNTQICQKNPKFDISHFFVQLSETLVQLWENGFYGRETPALWR